VIPRPLLVEALAPVDPSLRLARGVSARRDR
jgi:hypothetical protein